MHEKETSGFGGIEKLVESLELISARLLDITVSNNQIATSQTPEMRRLFDKWLECVEDEILQIAESQKEIDIKRTAEALGLSSSSTLSLLLSLERKGKLEITSVAARKGEGKNKEICDCLQ